MVQPRKFDRLWIKDTLTLSGGATLVIDSGNYSGADSYQPIGVDLNLAAAAGTSAAGDSAYLGAVMGNVLGSALTKTGNYVAGVIAAYNVTSTNASTYPVGALVAEIGDSTTTADGAVVAVIGGDSGTTTAGAAFKVMSNNSTAASGMDYGVDLQDAAHDGYQAVNRAFYKKAELRLTNDAVVFTNAGAPVNGTTLDNVAGKGSLCIDVTNGKLYINTGTITDSTWTVVGSQT